MRLRKSCPNCGSAVPFKSHWRWISSGHKDLVCENCSSVIRSTVGSLMVYVLGGILMVIAVEYEEKIKFFLETYGLQLGTTGYFVAVLIFLLLMIYIVSYITLPAKKKYNSSSF